MAKKGRKRRGTAPAEGERRALGGLLPQYLAAAWVVLRSLRRDELEFLELTHPKAGQVDDFVIGSPLRVDAFQVKWREHPKPFTFGGLARSTKEGAAPLIRQLADGWKAYRARYAGRHVVVHLFTCDIPSDQDGGEKPADSPSLAKFIAQAWNVAHDGDLAGFSIFPRRWEELQHVTALNQAEFQQFVQDCELTFNARISSEQIVNDRDAHLLERQLRELAGALKALAIDPTHRHHFTRSALLERLQWTRYFDLRNRHDFNVPDFYAAIESTTRKLNDALHARSRGYLSLLGPPGSGKSTLLTRMFEARAREERWVRYYAFVPGSQEPANTRGESENFLHDLTTSIDRAGIRAGLSRSDFDRQQLLERLNEQIRSLGEDYASNGHRWVILIDGLDHVPREQRVDRSFLSDLPDPSRLPQGVFVLLGTQTLDLPGLPSSVRAELREPDRCVTIEPLTKQAVNAIAAKRLPRTKVDRTHEERIFSISAGHPLALALLLNQIPDGLTGSELEELLDRAEPYAGDIDRLYESHWKDISDDFELCRLLALTARFRRQIDLDWLHAWAKPEAVHKFKRELSHLFLQETDTRWYFFHNSFRLFVRGRTSGIAGATSEVNDRALHREIAYQCAKAPESSPWRWEELFHLVEAGEHSRVIALANTEYFRKQLLTYRPADSIITDVRHALRSAGAAADVVACTRLILCAAEMGQRGYGIEEQDVTDLLLDLDLPEVAATHLFDGQELRVGELRAMKACRRLWEMGRKHEAQRLFDRGEPLNALRLKANSGLDPREENDALVEWVRSAPRFRPVSEVLALVNSVERPEDEFRQVDAEERTEAVRRRLLFNLAIELDSSGREQEARLADTSLNSSDPEDFSSWFWIQARRWKRHLDVGDRAHVAAEASAVTGDPRMEAMDAEAKAFLAEVLYLSDGDSPALRTLVDSIAQPKLDLEFHASGDAFSPYLFRFRLNRLRRALGKEESLSDVVPDAAQPEFKGLVLLERAVVRLAHVWGDAWKGRQYTSAEVRQQVFPILRLYDRSWSERRDWRNWHSAESAQEQLFEILVRAVAQHGHDALEELRAEMLGEWASERARFWPASLRRAVLLQFFDLGSGPDWIRGELKSLDSDMLVGQDVSGRVTECSRQAKAYAQIGDLEAARGVGRKMLEVSFGVGYRKDYQLDSWIGWLPLINAHDPAGAADRFSWFARAALALEESTTGTSASSAASELVDVAFKWSPRRAVRLFFWFYENQIVSYTDALEQILTNAVVKDPRASAAAAATLGEFLLPITEKVPGELSGAMVKAAAQNGGTSAAVDLARTLAHRAAVYALPGRRAGIAKGMAEALSGLGEEVPSEITSLAEAHTKRPESSSDDDGVRLKSGELLSRTEFAARSANVDALVRVANELDETSKYHLRSAIEGLAKNATVEDLERLRNVVNTLESSSLALTAISERFSELGERNRARDVAAEALAASSDYGWSLMADGATRLRALEAWVAASPVEGRSVALRTFIKDVTSPGGYPGGLAQNLLRVIPLLVEEIPVASIWRELEVYLHALCPQASQGTDPDLAETPEEDVPDCAICDVLRYHVPDLSHVLAQGSQRALAQLLSDGNGHADRSIKKLLHGPDESVVAAVSVLAALSQRDPAIARRFVTDLLPLVTHPNFAVWKTAMEILETLHVSSTPKRAPVEIPAVYKLQLPRHREGLRSGIVPGPGETMPNTDDPVERLAPFDSNLKAIAEQLDAPAENLLYRAAELMKVVAPEEQWTSGVEKRTRARLESAGMKFSYRRPRAVAARNAMFRAVSELSDAGLIPEKEERFFWEMECPYDPRLMLAVPSRKPNECMPIQGLNEWHKPEHSWVQANQISSDRLLREVGDEIVLGEATQLRRPSWDVPEEVVASGVVRLGPGEIETPPPFKRLGLSLLINQYLKIPEDRVMKNLVVRASGFRLDSPGGDWLALNPDVGRFLSWQLDSEGLFRWRNVEGELMVETRWWQDGNVEHHPYIDEEEVGEGWIVVCSRKALGIVTAQLGPLKRAWEVTRTFHEQSQEYKGRRRGIEVV